MTDPLDVSINLAGVDTTIPLLPEAIYDFQISEITVEPNKEKTGRNLVVVLKTITPIDSVPNEQGEVRTVKPGFPLKMYFALQPSQKEGVDPEGYKRNLSDLIDAAIGSTINDRPDLNMETINNMKGKTVRGTVKFDEYQGRKNNKVARLQKVQ
jgi:hypothetical protein